MRPARWTWERVVSIFTQRKVSLPSDAATGSGVVYGLIWPQNRYWHAQKWFPVGSHVAAELQKTLWLSGCVPVCIPPCTPIEKLNGIQAESSEQCCEASNHKNLRSTQQADLGQFMWSIQAHLLLYGHHHSDLVSLSYDMTGDSEVNCHNAEEVAQQPQQHVIGKHFAASKNEEES